MGDVSKSAPMREDVTPGGLWNGRIDQFVDAGFAHVSRNPSDHETVIAYRTAIALALAHTACPDAGDEDRADWDGQYAHDLSISAQMAEADGGDADVERVAAFAELVSEEAVYLTGAERDDDQETIFVTAGQIRRARAALAAMRTPS
jgi:hypothetical protein